MPYSQKIIETIHDAPEGLGTELGRWAVRRDVSMQRISQIVGASRQTIYNWFTGATDVTPAYQDRVAQVIAVLKKTSQTDDAWRILCTTFNLKL
jgi:hypothetical protein